MCFQSLILYLGFHFLPFINLIFIAITGNGSLTLGFNSKKLSEALYVYIYYHTFAKDNRVPDPTLKKAHS